MLLKPEFGSIFDALKDDLDKPPKIESISGVNFYFLVKQNRNDSPKWLKIFNGAFSNETKSLYTASNTAVLAYEVDSRWFVIPFGFGRSMLKPGSYEENFGLKVVLNSVNPKKLRSIDAKNLEIISINQRSQASKATKLDDFGVNFERDILYAATGEAEIKELGKNITGKDSIKLITSDSIEKIPELSRLLLKQYAENTYKEAFPWIDNLLEVRDGKKLQELDELLISKLRSKSDIITWMTIPDVIEWEDVDGFKFYSRKSLPLYDDLSWEAFYESVCKQEDINVKALKDRAAICIGRSNGGEPIHHWQVYHCIYAEVELNGRYILNNGHWYRVNADFLESVESFYKNIELSNLDLPEYNHTSEGAYNKAASELNPNQYALCDANNINHGLGSSKIEFCDLISQSHEILHVKRYGGSSVLSHLFSQGFVSAKLFKSDITFQEKARSILPENYQGLWTKGDNDFSKFTVIFGVISNGSEVRPSLPLFSKITLKNAVTSIRTMGFKVKIQMIPISKEYIPSKKKSKEIA